MSLRIWKLQAIGAVAALLCAAAGAGAASVTFTEAGVSGSAPVAAFTVSNGQLQINLSTNSAAVVPSTMLTGVLWTMAATPVLAVEQASTPVATTTFPIPPPSVTTQYTFKTSVSVDPNLWMQFASYSATKGVSGSGFTSGAGVMALGVADIPPLVTVLSLPSSFEVINSADTIFQYGTGQRGPVAAGAFPAIGVAVPVPPALWMGLSTLAALGLYRRVVRRRRS